MHGESRSNADWTNPSCFPQLCAYLSEGSPVPLIALEGPAHIIRYANPAFCRLARIHRARLAGRPFADAVPEAPDNLGLAMLDRVLRTGVPEVLDEQSHGRGPGSYWSYSAWPILDVHATPIGVAVKITDATAAVDLRREMVEINQALLVSSLRQHEEAQQLAAELREAMRLASLSALAAGIGHDLGNLLFPARIHLDAIEKEAASTPAREGVAAIRAAFTYLQGLAGSLRLFAASPDRLPPPQGLNIARWWREFRPLIRGVLPVGVTLADDLEPHTPPDPALAALIAPAALSQIVYNLVQNAGEAMKEHATRGGRITVAAARAPASDRVRITVADNGPGMTPEVLRRCTEPFFSTKASRVSTGMGLSIVKGLVAEAGGRIELRSEPGLGAAFTIDLPAVPPRAPAPDATPADQTTCRVAITTARPQTAAYLAWVARDAGAAARIHDSPDPPDADLWIVAPRPGDAPRLRDFIAAADRDAPTPRRVLRYAEPAPPPAPVHSAPVHPDQPPRESLTSIDAGLPIAQVRDHIQKAIRNFPRPPQAPIPGSVHPPS